MRRLLAALALVVAGAGFAPAPATAAGGFCTGGGASVVVDYGALGGSVVRACGSAGTAAAVFKSAGVKLTYNQRMGNGFVCTVNGKPADKQCAGTNSYWALFISKDGGGWKYANFGVGSQSVADGDTIAFAWQATNSKRPPGVAPATPRKASPTADPTTGETESTGDGDDTGGGGDPRSTGSSATASPTPSESPSASPSAKKQHKHKHEKAHKAHKASAGSSPRSGTAADATRASVTDDADDSGGGLPWWIPVAVVVLLGAGGGTVAWRRRGTRAH